MREERKWLLEEIGRVLRQADAEQLRMVWWFVKGMK